VTKQFSDGSTDKFRSVKFKMYNTTDNYFVKAHESEEGSGIWYVDGHVDEANATMLIPSASTGKLVIYGLEDDTYNLREMETASGYTLLKDPVVIVISAPETKNAQTHKAQRVMSATVDGDARPGDDALVAGTVALTVVNQKGFDLPKTGGEGTMWYAIGGICGLAIVTLIVVFLSKKRKKDEEDA
jgi:LPXTG-motif cell wall-anchored protein